MNFLGRPVFEFPIDWSDAVNKAFTFDLAEVNLGFGAPAFTSAQRNVVQGFDCTIQLATPADIAAFDAFTAALVGRLNGFWFPSPFVAGEPSAVAGGATVGAAIFGAQMFGGIAVVVSASAFDIVDQDYAETWDAAPDVYLYFAEGGQTACAKIVNVVDLGNGFERITLDAAVPFLSAATIVRKLHYVRLADDIERARFEAEGWQQRFLRVVELPEEYALTETGERPIWLFHFWMNRPVDAHWYFTSFAADVASGGKLYEGARPGNTNLGIDYLDRREGTSGDDSLTIECAWHVNHPLAFFVPIPITAPMFVQVSEVKYSDLETVKIIATGRVTSPQIKGEKLVCKCETFGAIFKRKAPQMTISPVCNYFVYTPACKAPQYRFETTAQIEALHNDTLPPTIEVTLRSPTDDRKTSNWFAQGWLESSGGLEFEIRTILASSYDVGADRVTLTLNAPLLHAEVGDVIQLIPGCDGAKSTCLNKFNNYDNFGGFFDVPAQNLSLTPVDTSSSVGNKK